MKKKIKFLDWNAIHTIGNPSKVKGQLQSMMKDGGRDYSANYGFEEGNWNLTDIMITGLSTPGIAQIAYGILLGMDENGRTIHALAPDVKFRLRVHSRQACYCDKNENELNKNEINPKEQPHPGDMIRMEVALRPAEDRKDLATREMRKWATRGEDLYLYDWYEIDDDLCITVPMTFAHKMLKLKGKRLVFPEFARQRKSRTVGVNWLYEEVSTDYKLEQNESAKKTEKPKKVE